MTWKSLRGICEKPTMSSHARKPSARAALPRRSTRGPLDDQDPLSAPSLLPEPGQVSPGRSVSQLARSVSPAAQATPDTSLRSEAVPSTSPPAESKDLAFLLEPSIYHPVSQLDVPPPLRRALPSGSPSTLDGGLVQIESCISQCHFLGAAHLAELLLSSALVPSTDTQTIFRLLSIRYACLELSGNVLLAAQEAKALEDIGSAFYYTGLPESDQQDAEAVGDQAMPNHIMPFSLRLQALRLQSIGFSDARRGVSALYDLGTECREHIFEPSVSLEDRLLWTSRLEEVGIRVTNALIELGDLDCAKRTLDGMRSSNSKSSPFAVRHIMLCLKMGLLAEATQTISALDAEESVIPILRSLVAIAEDNLDEATELLGGFSSYPDHDAYALAKQNLAVALLYKGEIQAARTILDELVRDGNSFQTLTINLATIFDLSSDRSRDLKMGVVTGISRNPGKQRSGRAYTNADFKL